MNHLRSRITSTCDIQAISTVALAILNQTYRCLHSFICNCLFPRSAFCNVLFYFCVLNQDVMLFCDSVIFFFFFFFSNARTIFVILLNNLAGHMFVGKSVRLLTGC